MVPSLSSLDFCPVWRKMWARFTTKIQEKKDLQFYFYIYIYFFIIQVFYLMIYIIQYNLPRNTHLLAMYAQHFFSGGGQGLFSTG